MLKLKIVSVILITSLLTSCSAPTPQQDLLAAVAALDIISVLPGLTPADKLWIAAASEGLTCASGVLAKKEPAAQEALDITKCLSNLPIVPPQDQPYISAGIGLVNVFIALFTPSSPTPAMINDRMKTLKSSDIPSVTRAIHDRVSVH
jgi:hypothetical protein